METIPGFVKEIAELLKALQIVFVALGGGFIAWLFARKNYKAGSFRNRIEIIGVEPTSEGIDFHSQGPQLDLNAIISIKRLEQIIVTATKRMGGSEILRLPNGTDQRRMMEILEDWLTGNDPRANMAAVKGRPVHEDVVGFCPTFYHETGDDAMVRVYVFDPEFVAKFLDDTFTQKQRARKPRFQYRVALLQRIAHERVSERSKSGATAAVWHTIVKTSKTEVVSSERIRAA